MKNIILILLSFAFYLNASSIDVDNRLQIDAPECSSGFVLNNGKCQALPSCPSDSFYNFSSNRCEILPISEGIIPFQLVEITIEGCDPDEFEYASKNFEQTARIETIEFKNKETETISVPAKSEKEYTDRLSDYESIPLVPFYTYHPKIDKLLTHTPICPGGVIENGQCKTITIDETVNLNPCNSTNTGAWNYITSLEWTGSQKGKRFHHFLTYTVPEQGCYKIEWEGRGYTDMNAKLTYNGAQIGFTSEHHSSYWNWGFSNDSAWKNASGSLKYSKASQFSYQVANSGDKFDYYGKPTHSSSKYKAARMKISKRSADGDLACKPGYSAVNGKCQITTYTPLTCNSGYSLDYETCKKTIQVCPSNTVELSDGRCQETTMSCESGYTQNGGICEINSICPPGFIDNGSQCEKTTLSCDDGFTLSGSACVMDRKICPSGYENNGNNCLSRDYSCPSGFEENSEGQCVNSNADCPAGYDEFGDEIECRRNLICTAQMCRQPELTCPIGTTKQDFYLKAVEETCADGDPSCTQGNTLIKTPCSEEARNSCPSGYTHNSAKTKCLKAPVSGGCDSFASLSGGMCQTNTIDLCTGNTECVAEGTPYCEQGYKYNSELNVCEAEGYCLTGYKMTDEGCFKDYTYSTYTCPSGFEGPVSSSGGDCLGSCGPYGCECNPTIPPANNCKKAITSNANAVTVVHKRDFEVHSISGSVNPLEYGEYKGFSCGKDCDFIIKEIIGVDDKLCFKSGNGRESCVSVSGCGFEGKIENVNNNNYITELDVHSPYVLGLGKNTPPPDIQTGGFKCPDGLVYDETLQMCDSIAQNFYEWRPITNGGDGNWVVKDGGARVYQTVNANRPTFFLSPTDYPNGVTMEGKIKVNRNGDDDYIGIVFDYKDQSNYRLIRWSKKGDTHHSDILIYANIVNGQMSVIARNDSQGWADNRWYTIKVVFNEDVTQVYIDDSLKIEHDSRTSNDINMSHLGPVGFYNYSQGSVNYKDFYIQSQLICGDEYEWQEETRSCIRPLMPAQGLTIKSTCRMNGHVSWPQRDEGIISIKVDENNPSRMNFWDSYMDKYLGFLEFPHSVSAENREDGFGPEDPLPYEMNEMGFTASETINNNTFFVTSQDLSADACRAIAADKGLFYSEAYPDQYSYDLKRLSGNRYQSYEVNPDCADGFYDANLQRCIVFSQYDKEKATHFPGMIWAPNGSDNFQSSTAFFAPYTGYYTFTLETLGSLNFAIDGLERLILRKNGAQSVGDYTSAAGTPKASYAAYLTAGTHVLSVLASKDIVDDFSGQTLYYGEQGFSIKATDRNANPIFSSGHWDFSSVDGVCEDVNMISFNGFCIKKGIEYCTIEGSVLNETTGRCEVSPKCILTKPQNRSFSNQEKATKRETRIDSVRAYKCSPLVCSNNSCQTADCPVAAEGDPYLGTLLLPGDSVEAGTCLDDSCDANKPYYEYCAREGECDTRDSMTFEASDGTCKTMYCDSNLVMNIDTLKCEKLACPEGTTETAEGRCRRNN